MKTARLWPMLSAIVLLLAGTAALEVVAHNTEGRLLTWQISGNEVAVDGDGQDTDDESDESWEAAEATGPAPPTRNSIAAKAKL